VFWHEDTAYPTGPVRAGVCVIGRHHRIFVRDCYSYNINRGIHCEPCPDSIFITRCWLEKARNGIIFWDDEHNITDERTYFITDCVFKNCGYASENSALNISSFHQDNNVTVVLKGARFMDNAYRGISCSGGYAPRNLIMSDCEVDTEFNIASGLLANLKVSNCRFDSVFYGKRITNAQFSNVQFEDGFDFIQGAHDDTYGPKTFLFTGCEFARTNNFVFGASSGGVYVRTLQLLNCLFRLTADSDHIKTAKFFRGFSNVDDLLVKGCVFRCEDEAVAESFTFGNNVGGQFDMGSCVFHNCHRTLSILSGNLYTPFIVSRVGTELNFGIWRQGDIIFKAYPEAGQTPGWVCISGGGANGGGRANSTAYSVGDWRRWADGSAQDDYVVECITAGTTDSSAPSLAGLSVGDTVTDGTVVWIIRATTPAQFKDMAALAS